MTDNNTTEDTPMDDESRELDQNAGAHDQPVTFTLLAFEQHPGRFAMFRNVGDWTTHWLSPNGAWVPMPDSDEQAMKLLKFFEESGDLPEMEAM